jgi:hypothetical protein
MKPKTLAPSEGIRVDRTYRRCDLVALIPGDSEPIMLSLVGSYGLLPLGGKQAIFFGQHVIEALIRHAKDQQAKPERCRLTREELRAVKRQALRTAVAP